MAIPDGARLIFENGGSTADVVAEGILTFVATHVSERSARRWRQEWLAEQLRDSYEGDFDEDIFFDDEVPPTVEEIEAARRYVQEQMRLEMALAEQRRQKGLANHPALKEHDGNKLFPRSVLDDEQTQAELLEVMRTLKRIQEARDPTISQYEWTFEGEGRCAIQFVSCMHLGGAWTFHDKIREHYDQVAQTENAHMIQVGDEIEGFPPWFRNAKSSMEQLLPLSIQEELFVTYFNQVAKKTLAGLGSQHGGAWMEARTGVNRLKELYLAENIPYFDGKGLFTLHVGEQTYHVIIAHGLKGHSQYNLTHPHIKALMTEYPNANAIIMGDRHQNGYTYRNMFTAEAEVGIQASSEKHFIQVGTAKQGADPYTMRGWSKGQPGWWWLVFLPDRHEIRATLRFADVKFWLAGG